jgi:AcrR family transcriptional regulator
MVGGVEVGAVLGLQGCHGGAIRPDIEAVELLCGVGNLCIGADRTLDGGPPHAMSVFVVNGQYTRRIGRVRRTSIDGGPGALPQKRQVEHSAGTSSTYERILGVATELFAGQGYAATGVAELGSKARLGAGALYYHIGSKEDLLFQICRRHVVDTIAFGQELLNSTPDPERALRLLAHHHLHMIATRRTELLVTWRDLHCLTDERYHHIMSLRDEVEEIWSTVFRRGADAHLWQPVDWLFTKTAIGALNYSIMWFDAGGELRPEQVADRIIEILMDGGLRSRDTAPSRRAQPPRRR